MNDVKPENVDSWVEFLRSFETARRHFGQAYRHAMLGAAETARAFEHLTADPRAAAFGGVPATSLLEVIRRGLALLADRVPAIVEAGSIDLAKREGLMMVKEVLLAELKRIELDGDASEETRARVEALQAILRVVDLELERRSESNGSHAEASTAFRRVVIE